jgi:hypothetical protein
MNRDSAEAEAELAHAHRRIAELERAIAVEEAGPPGSNRLLGILSAGSLAVTLVGAVLFVLSYAHERGRARDVARDEALAPPAPLGVAPALEIAWDSAIGKGPLFVDVNGDGTDDVVGYFWDAAHVDHAVWLVALDGKDLAPVWRAGPYVGRPHEASSAVARVGDRLVFAESQGGVHVVDRAMGKPVTDWATGADVTFICAADDRTSGDSSSGRVVVGVRGGEARVLDLAKGRFEEGRAGATCARDPDVLAACNRGGPRPCFGDRLGESRHVRDARLFYEGNVVSVGVGSGLRSPDAGPLERAPTFGYGVRVPGGKVLWEGTLGAPGDRFHLGGDRADFDGTVFALGYQVTGGAFRIAVRRAETGELVWARDVRGSGERSRMAWLGIHKGSVYADVDGALLAFDLADGREIARVSSVHVPAEFARP